MYIFRYSWFFHYSFHMVINTLFPSPHPQTKDMTKGASPIYIRQYANRAYCVIMTSLTRIMFSNVLCLVLLLNFCKSQNISPCVTKETCGDCIREVGCVWCTNSSSSMKKLVKNNINEEIFALKM